MRTCSRTPEPPSFLLLLVTFTLALLLLSLLPGCATTAKLPSPAPEAIPVYIPVPVDCEVSKVPKSRLPSQGVTVPDDIFEAVKLALGDRAVALSDREQLSAANDRPCPAVK